MDLAIIVNRNAGRLKFKVDSSGFIDEISRFGRVYVSEDVRDISDITDDIYDNGVSRVAVMGGDGTVHRIITEAYNGERSLPSFILLGEGTINNVKNHFYGKRSWKDILTAIDDEARTVIASPLEVRCGNEKPKYGFLFGMGMVTRFLEAYYSQDNFDSTIKELPAVKMAVKSILSLIFRGKLARSILAADKYSISSVEDRISEQIEGDFTALLAGNIPSVGLGFKPLPGAGCLYNFQMIVSYADLSTFLKNIYKMHNGTYKEKAIIREPSAVCIEEGPGKYILEGEIYTASYPLSIDTAHWIRFIVPT